MTGYALQDDQATDGAVAWPGELDEQLISEIFSDESLLGGLLHVPGESEHHCSGDTGPDDATPAQCNSRGDRSGTTAAEIKPPQPGVVIRALCSVYSGPTILDIEKALSSGPCNRSNRRHNPVYFGRFGAESKYTTKVRSCSGKTPSDGFKWRKYGQKLIKNNPYPRNYYKCTSSRCGAKKQVEKSVDDDPEMLIVTYMGSHQHAPQPPPARRHWPYAGFSSGTASGSDGNGQHTCDGAEARGGGGGVAAGDQLRGRQNGLRRVEGVVTRSCDGGSVTSPVDAAAWPACDSPPATAWSCPDFYYSSWSPEALLPY